MQPCIDTRGPRSRLCSFNEREIHYGRDNLVDDLLGKASFIDVFMGQTLGRMPSDAERRMAEAVLIVLMEHGLTPSAIATRMVYLSSPENLQSGVAAGLLAVGSQFVGTMEPAADLLQEIVAAGEQAPQAAQQIARQFREKRAAVPGFGHHLHRPDDPRAAALLALAAQLGISGAYCQALVLLSEQIDEAAGRHITINATGAVAAVLGDMKVPAALMRGFAVLARTAGLISHIAEEQREPLGRCIWDMVDQQWSEPA